MVGCGPPPRGSFGSVEAAGSFEYWGVGFVAFDAVAAVAGVVVGGS